MMSISRPNIFSKLVLIIILFFCHVLLFGFPFSASATITKDLCEDKNFHDGACRVPIAPGDDGCDEGEVVVDTCSDVLNANCCVEQTGNPIDTDEECNDSHTQCTTETTCDLIDGWDSGFQIGTCTDSGTKCCKKKDVIDTDTECTVINKGECKSGNTCGHYTGSEKLGTCSNGRICCTKDPDSSSASPTIATAEFDYKPLEPIPGVSPSSSSTLKGFIEGLYLFVMWSVGIAAMFMIVLGGFWYMTSAGNTARVGEAKNMITNALWGLVVALVAWLLLFVINPDLVNIDLSSLDVLLLQERNASSKYKQVGGGIGPGNGQCEPVLSEACSVSNLSNTCLAGNAEVFSNICNVESTGSALKLSNTDKCKDGRPFSVGLFQINLTVHSIGSLNCPNAFNGRNFDCTVRDESLYNQCVTAAQNPNTNIQKSCQISKNGSNVGPWLNSSKKCGYL